MPRDGSGNYTQPFPEVEEDTPIESAVYNGFVADVATDLNAPRPIIAGGTGATNKLDAMIALGGEIAEQVVVNYDSFPFESGSFYSAGSATAGPVDTHAFVGIAYRSDDNNIVLEARDQTDTVVPGTLYVREKKAGVWSAWVEQAGSASDIDAIEADIVAVEAAIVALDAAKVNRAGDTMTGVLTVNHANAQINLTKTAVAQNSAIYGYLNATPRWAIMLGDGNPETGGNVGSYFGLHRFADDGAYLGSSLSGDRASGAINFTASPTAPTPPPLDDSVRLATTEFNNHAARLINNQNGDYTFVIGDAGRVMLHWIASPHTYTIPPFSSVPFPAGTQIDIMQIDTGQLTIAPGAGVNLHSEDNKRKLSRHGSAATLVNVTADHWILAGSLEA